MDLHSLASLLSRYRFNFTSETEFQVGVAQLLDAQKIPYIREAPLEGRDRIDFLLGSVGLELKVDGSLSLVTRQVHRYLQHESLSGLVLLTSRQKHSKVPSLMNNKPVIVVQVPLL